jgi:hypothetical protein
VEAPVADVSAGGIGVLAPECFEAGTSLGIVLPATPAASVLACVVHATPRPGPPWALGCQFALPLGKEDLPRFDLGPAHSRFFERRAWTRYTCSDLVTCWPVRVLGVRRLSARPVSVTCTDAVTLATHPVNVGMVLEWEMPGALTILASVARVTTQGNAWAVTCQFVRDLTDSELQAVGANRRADQG